MADGAQAEYDLNAAPLSAPAAGGFEEFDPKKVIAFLRRRLNVIAGCIALITALAALISLQITPIYTASAEVLIDSRETNVANMESVLSGLSLNSDVVDTEVEVIRSRQLLKRVVRELGLIQDPEFNLSLQEPGLIARLNPMNVVRGALGPAEDNLGLTDEERAALQEERVVTQVLQSLRVARSGLTFVIRISVKSESPHKAAELANAIANAYLVDQMEAKFEATQRANEWLSARLSDLRDQLRISEDAVEIFRSENDLFQQDGATLNEQQLGQLNAQLALSRADRAEKQARLRRVEELLRSGRGVDAVAEVLASNVIVRLREQQAVVVRKRAELSSRYGDRHPEMIKVRRELSDLENQISAEVQRIVSGLRNDVEAAAERERSLERSLGQLKDGAAEDDRSRVRLRELEREAEANRALYESFLNRFKETTGQEGLQEADARKISEAIPPLKPSSPKVKLNVAAAFAFASVLGIGLALVLERLDSGFRTAEQVESALGLMHLASIPKLDRTQRKIGGKVLSPQDYILARPLSAFAEALRFLRTAVMLSDVDRKPKTLLFTSAMPNEGKTTTAVCFARSAASSGVRTILVDADLRRPSVHRALDMKPEVGLIEHLSGQSPLEDVILHDEESGLDVVPVIHNAATPPDLLASEAVKALLRRLASDYDLVVLDSAPVLPVAATKALAQAVDKTIFIARWQDTPRDASRSAVKDLRLLRVDLAGAVLSQVDVRRQKAHGYGDPTYYQGRYETYYTD
ncbi:MAG: Wzz/FepE/Etk N-terminal domain-containing protein [Pseudomonadota bacterium]